jgi:hypothetical protein
MQQYTIPAPFLKINYWSDLRVGENRFVPLQLKVRFVINTEKQTYKLVPMIPPTSFSQLPFQTQFNI